jgi:hypothetical protein
LTVRYCALVIVPLLAWAGTLQVAIRDSEIWLIGDGGERQLTQDGKAKERAALSPSLERIAYIEQCAPREDCTPSIVVLDLEGNRVRSFQPMHESLPQAVPCGSILSIAWTGESAIAAECHINPSLNQYIETDISTGRKTRDLLGYDFTPSPDGKLVAHVGWIVHFAPPYAKSNYLQVEHLTIYPLPEGMRPVEQVGLTEPPTVVRQEGQTYRGIHDFQHVLSWSPDSQRIALIDCTYDWTPNWPGSLSAGDGEESGRRCSLAVVTTTGKPVLFPLDDAAPADLYEARLSWLNPRQLSLEVTGLARTFSVP